MKPALHLWLLLALSLPTQLSCGQSVTPGWVDPPGTRASPLIGDWELGGRIVAVDGVPGCVGSTRCYPQESYVLGVRRQGATWFALELALFRDRNLRYRLEAQRTEDGGVETLIIAPTSFEIVPGSRRNVIGGRVTTTPDGELLFEMTVHLPDNVDRLTLFFQMTGLRCITPGCNGRR